MSLKHAAQYLASHGRGADSMLMHVAPDEVARLQAAAQAQGGSLTINPHTGLPEADFFSDLNPFNPNSALGKSGLAPIAETLLLNAIGVPDLGLGEYNAAATIGGVNALATGSLQKGLMAGLQAYGTQGLLEGISKTGTGVIAQEAGKKAVEQGLSEIGQEQAVSKAVQEASGLDKIMTGLANPGTAIKGLGLKDLKYGLLAGAPVAMAADQKKSGLPSSGSTGDGYIRQYYYDPVSHSAKPLPPVATKDWGSTTFESRVPYLPSAAKGGLQAAYAMGGVTDDGMAGGGPMMGSNSAFDFQQHSEPVVRMAEGGDTKYTQYTPEEINNYIAANNLNAAGIAEAEKKFNADPAAVEAAQQSLARDPYTYYTPRDIADYITENKLDDAGIAAAEKRFNADPQAVADVMGRARDYAQSPSSGMNTKGLEALAKALYPELYFANVAEDVARGNLGLNTLTNLASGITGGISSGLGGIGRALGFADGGAIKRYDGNDGSLVSSDSALAAYQAGDYAGAAKALSDAGMSAQDVVSKYGLSPTEAATVAQNLGYTGNLSNLTYGGAPSGGVSDPALAAYQAGNYAGALAALNSAGMSAQDVVNKYGLSPAQAAVVAQNLGYTGNLNNLTYGGYTPYTQEQIGNFFTNPANKDVVVADAIKQFKADPAAVNKYISGLISDYRDPTATQRGTGYLQDYLNLGKAGMTASETLDALRGINKDWGKEGYWNPTTLTHAYDVAQKVLAFDPITDKVTPSDKEWVAFMDKNQISVDDISRATGLTKAEVQARYDAAKEKPIIPPVVIPPVVKNVPVTTPGTTTATYTGGATTTPLTYAPAGTTTPYGNLINPGDITRNVDSTLTVTPNVSGRPYGGYTGIGQLRDAYTAGGGRLGQVLAPTKAYTTTGASADAYRYLMGLGKYPVEETGLGKNYRYYWGVPPSTSTTNKYWINPQTRVYELNPNYVDPAAVAAAKAAATTTTTNPTDFTPGGKSGGLMDAYAAGGDAHYNLGGYSDGGRLLRGPGDGVSDSIPATIGNRQPARLADGEFVVPARIVSELGNGSTEAGARKLYAMMDRVQKARGKTVGKGKIAKNTRSDKYLPA